MWHAARVWAQYRENGLVTEKIWGFRTMFDYVCCYTGNDISQEQFDGYWLERLGIPLPFAILLYHCVCKILLEKVYCGLWGVCGTFGDSDTEEGNRMRDEFGIDWYWDIPGGFRNCGKIKGVKMKEEVVCDVDLNVYATTETRNDMILRCIEENKRSSCVLFFDDDTEGCSKMRQMKESLEGKLEGRKIFLLDPVLEENEKKKLYGATFSSENIIFAHSSFSRGIEFA